MRHFESQRGPICVAFCDAILLSANTGVLVLHSNASCAISKSH